MKVFCPSCGSPVEFRYDDSFVRVCGSCRSALVRTDRGIDTFGQVADLTPTRSGLALGDRGRFQGEGFELIGRAQFGHPAGGRWEEWFLKLAGGRWAWLSEAQGAWVLTFPRPAPAGIPAWSEIEPGSSVALGDPPVRLTVGERNLSSAMAAEGELPFQFIPGERSRFADLSDGRGRFATLDYGLPESDDSATLYLGRRVTLAELGLAPVAQVEERELQAERLSCPNCGGSVELRLPGRSLSVVCPYCASVLDCEGPLSILEKHDRADRAFPISLGATGEFDGVRYVVTGRMRRRAVYEGVTFAWDELLLYEPSAGYRWLVLARGHWSFVTPLSPGSVGDAGEAVFYDGQRFALYDTARSEVIAVWGEFYWKVHVGESVETRDYIAPPAMLSYERSESEVHWSLGIYKTPEQIRRAFGLERVPSRREGVAGNQPFAHAHMGRVLGLLAIGLVAGTLLRMLMADPRQIYAETFYLGSTGQGERHVPAVEQRYGPSTYVMFTPAFELRGGQNTRVQLSLPVHNAWVYALVDLVHEASGELRTFDSEISYYFGTSGGESWSEGGQTSEQVLPAGLAGQHLLRLEVQSPTALSQLPLSVKVEQDVFPLSHLGWAFLLLAVPGTALGMYRWLFERFRWSESDYAPALYRAGTSDE